MSKKLVATPIRESIYNAQIERRLVTLQNFELAEAEIQRLAKSTVNLTIVKLVDTLRKHLEVGISLLSYCNVYLQ